MKYILYLILLPVLCFGQLRLSDLDDVSIVNPQTNDILTKTSRGWKNSPVTITAPGADREVIFNDAGSFGASSTLTLSSNLNFHTTTSNGITFNLTGTQQWLWYVSGTDIGFEPQTANGTMFFRDFANNRWLDIDNANRRLRLYAGSTLRIGGSLQDGSNSAGSSGQVLSSTGSATAWTNAWLVGGNSVGATGSIGSIGGTQVNIITSNTERARFPATGGFSVGAGTFTAATGVINTATGYRVNDAATSGQYLRGNGTNFVSSAIQFSDLPAITIDNLSNVDASGATDLQILQFQTGTSTWDNVDLNATSIPIADAGSKYTATNVETALQEIGFTNWTPADGATLALTTKENMILVDGGIDATVSITLNEASVTSGTRMYIKGISMTTLTLNSSTGNFMAAGATSGASTLVPTGTFETMLIFNGGTWYQMY